MNTSIIIGIPPIINRWPEQIKRTPCDHQQSINPVALNALKNLSPQSCSLITHEVQNESPYSSQWDSQLGNFIKRTSSLSLHNKEEEKSPMTVTSKQILNESNKNHPSLNSSTRNFHHSKSLPSLNTGLPPLISTQRAVRFSDKCKVILVPARKDYAAAGIQLHWTEEDYKKFKESASNEELMTIAMGDEEDRSGEAGAGRIV